MEFSEEFNLGADSSVRKRITLSRFDGTTHVDSHAKGFLSIGKLGIRFSILSRALKGMGSQAK